MKYTVILLYPDYAADDYGADTYIESTDARTAKEAAAKVQEAAAAANCPFDIPEIPAEDFKAIAVFKGDLVSLYP